ncbi:MAG: polyphenol oxidase family protein [Verrucomicrobia bacterium]|nr:polyphenol oxidase family protein [Verrucomicrobiota bacterium]
MSELHPTVEVVQIPGLSSPRHVAARFIGRIPNVGVALERDAAMRALAPHQISLLKQQGLGSYPLVTAEQIHGHAVALVTESSASPIEGVDGLLTTTRGITLGISVADCAPVWLVAKNGSAGGLLHSGKKGTELGIVPEGIRTLCSTAHLLPQDLILIIGPCIRPPCYEVDFAGDIRRQAIEAGISSIHDDGICTACHPESYYSYRRELGLTGRMLATLTLLPQ